MVTGKFTINMLNQTRSSLGSLYLDMRDFFIKKLLDVVWPVELRLLEQSIDFYVVAFVHRLLFDE